MRSGSLAFLVALTAMLAGWALLAYTVFGQTYAGFETRIGSDGTQTGREFTRSMFEMGLSPWTAAVLIGMGIAYLLVAIGAGLNARGFRWGRWVMLVAVLPVIGLNLISFGLVLLLPATVIAAVATVLAFASRPAGTLSQDR